MLVGIYHDWPTRPETQASTPERSDRARSSQAYGVRKLLWSFALPRKHCLKTIPWFEQIQKVSTRNLEGHNGRDLKLLWVSCFEICQPFLRCKKKPRPKGRGFLFDAWQSRTGRVSSEGERSLKFHTYRESSLGGVKKKAPP